MSNFDNILELTQKFLTTPIDTSLIQKIRRSKKFIYWFLLISLFTFSILLRLWNLNAVGRTWDEYAYVNSGYKLIEHIKNRDFTNVDWYQIADHPPVARYFYGFASYFDLTSYTSESGKSFKIPGEFNYSWTTSRLVSVFFFSFTVLFVFFLGTEISLFVGITAAIIFTMLPISLGLSQLVTLESPLIFFFTGTVYFFLRLLKKVTIPKIIITGIFLGLALGVKLSNLLLLPLLPLLYIVWHFFQKKDKKKKNYRNVAYTITCIYGLAGIIFIVSWPGLWFHAGNIIHITLQDRFSNSQRSDELFFGHDINVPYTYYIVYFLLTTPLLIVILFFIGIFQTIRFPFQLGFVLLFWFLFPFTQSFYNEDINGIRYIIEIYVPLSLIAAVGLEKIANKLSKNIFIKTLLLSVVFFYLLITLMNISPYYLSYFNSIVGGAKGVYHNQLFPLGWWGEGQKEAGEYVQDKGSSHANLGLALIPEYVFPFIPYKSMEYIQNKQTLTNALSQKKFSFVFINYLFVEKTEFDKRLLYKNYKLVYSVMADGAPIVNVYMRK